MCATVSAPTIQLNKLRNRMVSDDLEFTFELQAYYNKGTRSHNFPVCLDIIARLPENLQIHPDLEDRLQDESDREAWLESQKKNEDHTDERLYQDQKSGANWLRSIRRGILADDQGTGKTVTSLAAVNLISPDKAIVVCSKIKQHEWIKHIQEWTDFDCAHFAHSNDPYDWNGFLVMSYGTAISKISMCQKADLLIMDEAHYIRNRKTKTFRSIRKIATKVDHIFLLTATPTVNVISDFWPLLCLVDPDRFGSYWGFVFRFCEVLLERMGIKVGNTKESEAENLAKILSRYTISRALDDLLPTPVWEKKFIDLSPEQRALYDSMKDDLEVSYGENVCIATTPLSQITRLRQLALSPALVFPGYVGSSKYDCVPDYVRQWDGKTLIFCQYSELALNCSTYLNREGIESLHLSHAYSDKRKEAILQQFKTGTAKVLAMTYKLGGEGLQLTEASQAIFLEYAWNHATMQHAYKRILRRGQKSKNIRFVLIHCVDTIEDHILDILKQKQTVTLKKLLPAAHSKE